jgi:hypothetical protein
VTLVSLLGMMIVAGCDQSPITPRQPQLPTPTIVTGADNDRTMGALSGVAQHIAAALQDPRVRGIVVRALRDTVNNPTGLDLSSCSDGVVSSLVNAGTLRGGSSASAMCRLLNAGRGTVLYMDRTRLAGWDSTVIPIVTAVADPSVPAASTFHGYVTPSLITDLKSDGSVHGPVLVVLPLFHARRLGTGSISPLPTRLIQNPMPRRGTRLVQTP